VLKLAVMVAADVVRSAEAGTFSHTIIAPGVACLSSGGVLEGLDKAQRDGQAWYLKGESNGHFHGSTILNFARLV